MADVNVFAFCPTGANQKLSPSAVAVRSTVLSDVNLRIANLSANPVFVKFGDSSVTATANDMPLPANWVEVFDFRSMPAPPGGWFVSIIAPAGASEVHITPGNGI